MAVQFVKSKMTLNFKEDKPTVYKIQQVSYSVVDTETLVEDVAESCGLNRAMTKAALEAIVSRVCRFVGMGHAVQLGDLGTVKPVFTAKTQETADTLGADNVTNKKIRFYPGTRLKQVVKGLSVSEYELSDSTIIEPDESTSEDTGSGDTGGSGGSGTEME